MNVLILVGLSVAVLLTAVGRRAPSQAQPPQVIYVQAAPVESPSGTGCLPLLILVGVILFAIAALG
jgi:hypothetical protein